ncbi:DUF692 domain-containing protein [bacterium]|nr:DUF692 domain-containing protein [bacterium]
MSGTACRGAGLGLRPAHLRDVLAARPAVPWFELHICNFMYGAMNHGLLRELREHYPLSFHGVSLNLGGVSPLDMGYLQQLKVLVDELEPGLVSEHACFTAHDGEFFHDLLPVPFSEASIAHMAERISRVQDVLGRQILIENVSRYYQYDEASAGDAQLSEGEFLAAVAERADCLILLDLNNARVNEHNLNESPQQLIDSLPPERLGEIHLAGYSERDNIWIDSHSAPVCPELWQLYGDCVERLPELPCLIEWDSELPDFELLMGQREQAQSILDSKGLAIDAESQSKGTTLCLSR